MSFSAVIVTRGDVPIGPIIDSIPTDDVIIWDNRVRPDVKVLGRYMGMLECKNEVVYVQDDDCLVAGIDEMIRIFSEQKWESIVCNMPTEFRHEFYEDHALVGFGAVMNRRGAWRAIAKYMLNEDWPLPEGQLERCCDIPVTGLMSRVLVNHPHENLPWATDDNRMYRQVNHQGERALVLDRVRYILGH